jgi:hypothetical protein
MWTSATCFSIMFPEHQPTLINLGLLSMTLNLGVRFQTGFAREVRQEISLALSKQYITCKRLMPGSPVNVGPGACHFTDVQDQRERNPIL